MKKVMMVMAILGMMGFCGCRQTPPPEGRGTHTHVQTSDARVLPRGTGYISDLGMTGPSDSVLGIAPEQSIRKFLGDPPRRYEQAKGPGKLEGAVFTVDTETGACTAVEAIRITP